MTETYKMCPECFGTYAHHANCSRMDLEPKPFTIREQKRNQGDGGPKGKKAVQ